MIPSLQIVSAGVGVILLPLKNLCVTNLFRLDYMYGGRKDNLRWYDLSHSLQKCRLEFYVSLYEIDYSVSLLLPLSWLLVLLLYQ